jgi:hypothetical protein
MKWIVANNGFDIHQADESFNEVATVMDKKHAALVAAAPELPGACINMSKAFADAPSAWFQTQDVADAETVMNEAIRKALIKY